MHGDAGVKVRNLRIASLGGAAARPPLRLGCQLWGVKDLWFGKDDKIAAFAEIFPKLKSMGYDGVLQEHTIQQFQHPVRHYLVV